MTPTRSEVNLAAEARFECSAHGIPVPTYEWLRESEGVFEPVELDGRVRVLNGSVNMLVFESTRREDAGQYRCVAMNEHGEITSFPAELVIRGT